MPPGRGSIAAHSAMIPAMIPHTPPSFFPKIYPEANVNTKQSDGRPDDIKGKGMRASKVVSKAADTQMIKNETKKSFISL